MNKELLEITALWLEAGAPERKFNMSKMVEYDYGTKPTNWCGTTCCIAGYVWQLDKDAEKLDLNPSGLFDQWDDIEHQAADALGLEFSVAHRLFYPAKVDPELGHMSYQGVWDDITAAQAARAVRNVMERGEPHWEEILDFDEEDY